MTGPSPTPRPYIADQIATTYEEEVTIEINAIGETFQPIVTVALGAVVCMLALALFRPLIDMVSTISSGAI